MNKTLLKSVEDFKKLISENTGRLGFYGLTTTYLDPDNPKCAPETYPCVIVWEIEDDDNGPSMLCGEFVYLSDFEET